MSGVYANGPTLLAHRRLSILDTSEAGRQPMTTTDGKVHIVFNGEIYNYRELRSELTGYRWQSDSDTEVLLHLYEEYGKECLTKLRGMFAFAIWDEKREELFLGRDRLGQKPLFYRHTDNGFWFGSTIAAILADDEVTPAPDLSAIRSYLTYQYVPGLSTGFETIHKLAPGNSLTVKTDGAMTRSQYWSLSYADKFDASPDTLASRLRSKLNTATELRMRSDVPLGAFLSGGVDSSSVVAMLSELRDEPVQTYSIGFDVDRYDELEYARLVADEFGTNHTEFTVDSDTMLDSVTDLIEHYQMPFADTSALPTYFVSKLASDDVTVALTGDAGDENFGGYKRYGFDQHLARLHHIPTPLRKAAYIILDNVPSPWRAHKLIRRPRKALEYAGTDPATRYALLRSQAYGDEIDNFWSGPSPDNEFTSIRTAIQKSDGPTRLDQLLQTDMRTYLPDDILVKVDRASMAHSLEVRSPFLDHRVVEFAAQIPARYKRHSGDIKWILKEAFRDDLPKAIIDREKKGFGVPANEWFRGGLRDMADKHLEQLGGRPPFSSQELSQILDHHIEGQASNGGMLWSLVMLEEWYQQYID